MLWILAVEKMTRYLSMVLGFTLLSFVAVVFSQERRSLSVADIEELLKAGVSQRRVAELIGEWGVNWEVTAEVKERLKAAGADAVVTQAVERAALEFSKRKLEEERAKAEADRRKVEEEKQRVEEERRKVEEEKRKIEEARRREEEERRKAKEEARSKSESAPKTIKGKDGAEMVLIPAGEFWMGCNDKVDRQCRNDEKPGRRVYLDAFYIDRFEVTNSQYERFMKGASQPAPPFWNSKHLNGAAQPVVAVSWSEAEAYCRWAGKRLPTEAEWEKAARGTDGNRYPWGDDLDSTKANYASKKAQRTVAVGSYAAGASPYGVHDMAGNVHEWVADWYANDYYKRAASNNPKGPDSGQRRVLRGGGWDSSAEYVRSSRRDQFDPESRSSISGFRCVQDVR